MIRELTGHGIGRRMHEEPTVFNWPAPAANQGLKPGLVFTIEPMVAAGNPRIVLDSDGWTVRTADRSLSAHEEHTIMVAKRGPVVITAPACSPCADAVEFRRPAAPGLRAASAAIAMFARATLSWPPPLNERPTRASDA